MDKDLKDVKFLPWVGNKYNLGLRIEDESIVFGTKEKPGKKVLVLGESFYTDNKDDVDSNVMEQVMNWYFDPNIEFEGWMNTYTKFIRAFFGKTIYRNESKEFWNSFIMYNYVQEPLRGTRLSPTTAQFDKSQEAFFSVLRKYKPDYVIVWGKRLYNNLPKEGKPGKDIYIDDFYSETWIYELENHCVKLLPIQHPSTGFDWVFWNSVIKIFLNFKI